MLLKRREQRAPRPVVEGDPRTDTRAAAAHIVGVLWASASQGLTVKERRAAIGLSRERLETAYDYLLEARATWPTCRRRPAGTEGQWPPCSCGRLRVVEEATDGC